MAGLDEQILQCLVIDGRASYRRIGEVVGVSEQTVARRYRALRDAGRVRVVAGRSGFTAGQRTWLVRIRCRPASAAALADALAERPDVRWVALVAGGNEVFCSTSVPLGATGSVLDQLPHTDAVLSFTAQALLRPFSTSRDEWTVFDPPLSAEQVTRLGSTRPARVPRTAPTEQDAPLLRALAHDGRASTAALARDLGWPASRVAARLETLLGGGALFVATDFLPEAFGFHASAILQLSVVPSRIVAVCEALATHRETGFVVATTGSADVMALVLCRSADDLFGYLTGRVGALDGVTAVDLVPYARRVKQAGCRVVDGRLVPPR